MISWVLDALRGAGIEDITIIVGLGAEQVRQALGSGYRYILQPEQLGSGHAVACAAQELAGRTGTALVMCGDSPLFTASTIKSLAGSLLKDRARIALASAVIDDPTGYGRIVRDASGRIVRIAEDKGASASEKAIKEVNGGCYAFDSEWLWANIGRIERNAAGELNLTDLVRVAITDGEIVTAAPCEPKEILGVNRPEDLRVVEELLGMREVDRT